MRIDQKHQLGADFSNGDLKGLSDGTYELEFQKSGYKKRSKQFKLDCDLMDQNNVVLDQTYLWRDKKYGLSGSDEDLVADEKAGGAKSTDVKAKLQSAGEQVFGAVVVEVLIDEDGNVVSASRSGGDKALAGRALIMARLAKFAPTVVNGAPVRVKGNLTYNFVP